jgi:hypothetical protein
MNPFVPSLARRRFGLIALAIGAATVAIAVVPAGARSADGSFAPTCMGSALLGESREDGQVAYRFACDTEIRGYSIIALDRQVDAFDTEPVVLDPADNAVPGQDFGCSATIPGFGVGCGGLVTAWNRVNGSVNLSNDPCKGPRPRFAVVVSDSKGRTAGPYQLLSAKAGPAGRPLEGCPAEASGKKKKHRRSRR